MGVVLRGQFLGLVGSRAIASLLQAVAFLGLARLVPVSELGAVGIVTSAGVFAALLTDFGVASCISRARARGNNALVAGGLLTNDLTAAILSVVGSAVILLVGQASPASIALSLLLTALAFERNAETGLSVPFADGNRRAPAVSILGRRIIGIGVFGILLLFGVDGLTAFCVGQVVGAAFGYVHKTISLAATGIHRAERVSFGAVFQNSWPFWVSAVMNQVRVVDTTVIGLLLGAHQAGIYSAAAKLVNPVLLMSTALGSIIMPHSARSDPRAAAGMANRISLVFTLTLIPIALPVIFSTQLSVFLFGEAYADSGDVLAWSLLSVPFVALAGLLTAILHGQGRERYLAVNGVVFAILLLAAMFVLTPLIGAAGAAIAIGSTSLLRCLILFVLIHRGRRSAESAAL